jgi:hypothetical protein
VPVAVATVQIVPSPIVVAPDTGRPHRP